MNTQTNKFIDLPPMVFSDLQAGDILLSRGYGGDKYLINGKYMDLSDIIVKLDGGQYSHAAFFDGSKLIQATTSGVSASDAVLQAHCQKFMHVYRFHGQDGSSLGSDQLPVRPLTIRAQNLVGTSYGYHELFLLGVILKLQQRSRRKYSVNIKGILIIILVIIKKVKKKRGKPKTLICSELVSEIFWKCSDRNGAPYGLQLETMLDDSPQFEMLTNDDEYDKLMNEIEAALEEIQPGFADQVGTHLDASSEENSQDELYSENSKSKIAGSWLSPSGSITPYDLEHSPSLELVGNYIDEQANSIKP